VAVVVRVLRRAAQAAAQGPKGEEIQVRVPFSSKKDRLVGWRWLGEMLAASPTRSSWEKERKARQAVRASVAEWALWARNRRRSAVAQSGVGGGAARECRAFAMDQ
jgi:hypothetical protein